MHIETFDIQHNSNTQLMVTTQRFIENDMTELTKYLMKLKHEPGFTLIISEFINK